MYQKMVIREKDNRPGTKNKKKPIDKNDGFMKAENHRRYLGGNDKPYEYQVQIETVERRA